MNTFERKIKIYVSSLTLLRSALQHSWEKIDSNIIHKLIKSIPNGVEAVLKAKGDHADY